MNSREKMSTTFKALLSCTLKPFMNSSNVKVRRRLDASRLVHAELSSLDSSINSSVSILGLFQYKKMVIELMFRVLSMTKSHHCIGLSQNIPTWAQRPAVVHNRVRHILVSHCCFRKKR